jgi:hypothetical protein
MRAFPAPQADGASRPARRSTGSNEVLFVGEKLTVTAAQLTAGALFGTIRLPKGAEPVGVLSRSTDLDTDGTPAIMLEIGDAGDTDRLMAASNIGQAGGASQTLAAAAIGYRYEEETLVQVRVSTAPDVAADGTIHYGVFYVSN